MKYFLILLMFTSVCSFAQSDFEKQSEKEGVVFYSTLKPSVIGDKNSRLALKVMVENTNDYPVNCVFTIFFYRGRKVIEHSQEINICIKPGKKVKGSKYGLNLVSSELTNEQLKDSSFEWVPEELTITKKKECPKVK